MGTWDAAAATHLYRRAGFGATRERVDAAVAGGLESALEDLFSRRQHEEYTYRGIRPLLALEKIEPLQAWWMNLILEDRAPLVERIALMWHDHFATSFDKVGDARMMHWQIELFREKGLGDFRELLHAVAKDPAMLVWLDGNSNKRGQANENFAREVLELFGLGIGNYTEHDIQEAARAFTGWGVDGRTFVFREQYHDPGRKEIFGKGGDFGGDEAIDLVLAHPACARHVARRLLQEFTTPNPSDGEVHDWSKVLVENDWNVERTLERLFRSELFLSPGTRRSRIAGPVEIVGITAVSLGAHVTAKDAVVATSEMGQSLYRPPSVKGWDGGRTWVHAGSWLARHNRFTQFALTERKGVDLAESFDHPASKGEVPDAVTSLLLPDGVEEPLKSALADAAARAENTDRALADVTALVLTAPEYHLI